MNPYSAEFDFPFYLTESMKVICLWFIPRSGSNFLADEMRKNGKLGYPLEYFSINRIRELSKRIPELIPDYRNIIKYRTSPNGVFSYKWNANFGVNLPFEPDLNIFIDRQNKGLQARSYAIAKHTGEWLERKTDYSPKCYQVDMAKGELSKIRISTLRLLKQRDYIAIYYEDLVKDSNRIIDGIIDLL